MWLRAGSGIPDIYATWREAGYIEPTVEELFGNDQPNRTIVTLPLTEIDFHHLGDEKGDEKSEDDERLQLIIALIKNNPKISIVSISKKTGLSKRIVEQSIAKLKSNGTVHREGSAKGGVWIINEYPKTNWIGFTYRLKR